MVRTLGVWLGGLLLVLPAPRTGLPQVPPSPAELVAYTGLHAAAARGDAIEIRRLLGQGADPAVRDDHGRTPLHVAAHGARAEAMRALVAGGADPNALDLQRYDAVTIAAVRGDVDTVRLAVALGTSPRNVTSPYDGTALIAAAHLGHVDVVRALVRAGAPLDHVNNLGWTALLEAVILGDGGPRHVAVLHALVEAGAAVGLADRQGRTPLDHARARGYTEMVRLLESAARRRASDHADDLSRRAGASRPPGRSPLTWVVGDPGRTRRAPGHGVAMVREGLSPVSGRGAIPALASRPPGPA